MPRKCSMHLLVTTTPLGARESGAQHDGLVGHDKDAADAGSCVEVGTALGRGADRSGQVDVALALTPAAVSASFANSASAASSP